MKPAGSLLLDSSIVIDHFRGDTSVGSALSNASALYLPAVALGELIYGVHRSVHSHKKSDELEDFLRIVTVLEVDRLTAPYYGKIRADLAHSGTPIPENDIWIAALALQHDLVLFARDAHFLLISELRLLGTPKHRS